MITPIVLLATRRRSRAAGGSTTPTTTCPATGASGTETLHAQSMFHPGLWPGWDMPGGGGTSPESFDGVEESFDPSSETAQISWDAVRWTINYTA